MQARYLVHSNDRPIDDKGMHRHPHRHHCCPPAWAGARMPMRQNTEGLSPAPASARQAETTQRRGRREETIQQRRPTPEWRRRRLNTTASTTMRNNGKKWNRRKSAQQPEQLGTFNSIVMTSGLQVSVSRTSVHTRCPRTTHTSTTSLWPHDGLACEDWRRTSQRTRTIIRRKIKQNAIRQRRLEVEVPFADTCWIRPCARTSALTLGGDAAKEPWRQMDSTAGGRATWAVPSSLSTHMATNQNGRKQETHPASGNVANMRLGSERCDAGEAPSQ